MPRGLVSVPHLGAARTYALDGDTLSALKNALSVCAVLGGKVDLESSSFQILDKTFDEYVDLGPDDSIPDLSKIQLRQHVEQQLTSASSEHIADNSVVASGSASNENCLHISFELPSGVDNDGCTFILPSLGNLHEAISSGSPLSSAGFRKVVDILFTDIKKITLFPTRNFYTKVTSLLLDKYPQLKDVVGSGADSWKVALRYKFKNKRRVLPIEGRVGQNRARFASRRNVAEAGATEELQRHKVQKMVNAISLTEGEDTSSFEKHTEWLLSESRKGSPNEEQIRERMTLTSRQRISEVSKISVLETKIKYPYLMNFERFSADFERMTKINLFDCITRGIDKIAKLAEMKVIPCEASAMASLQRACEMTPERLRTRHILTVAVLRVLSFNVKELSALPSLFVQEEELAVPATPCVVFSGAGIEDADLLHIRVDREKLFTVKNGEEGLAAVLSAYWLFNVQYDRKLFNTLVVLERLFLGLSLSAPRPVATKFLNKVTESVPL